MQIRLSASCLEKDDLVALLTSAIRRERRVAAFDVAATVVTSQLVGMPAATVCGCPTGGLAVAACEFARQPDGAPHFIMPRAVRERQRCPA